MLQQPLASEADIAGPHLDLYNDLYRQLNPNNLADIEAPVAAQFLRSSGIELNFLSQIWELADYRHLGRLDKRGCFISFKLVAAVQNGHPPLAAALLASINPPTFAAASGRTSALSEPVDWDIDDAEQAKYASIFESLGPVNGRLSGEQVRPVLLNSRLPSQKLARIWELADIDRDGHLDRPEMYLALHLVYRSLQNEPLPDRLPISLVHPTKRHFLVGTPSRRQSSALAAGPSASPVPRYPLSQSSRTSSISSLNRSVIESIHHDSYSPVNAFRSVLDPKNLDQLDTTTTEPDFTRFDTDMDGFVDGADVKEPLMASGLPQQILAKIWGLVDTARTGRLNLPQFTLLIQFVKECRNGITPPDYLPPHLASWLSTANTPTKLQLPSNPRIDELNGEISELRDERQKAEQDLFQLNADTSVKNSEIKNAEIELNTLTMTVKQLRNQKGEASKRLADLDDKILQLEATCEDLTKRLKAEEERVNSVKEEIKSAEQNQESEQQVADSLRGELRELDLKFSKEQANLTHETGEMERIVDELTRVERHVDTNKDEVERLEKMIDEMERQLKEAENLESPTGDEAVLFKQFQQFSLNGTQNGFKPTNTTTVQSTADAFGSSQRPLYDTVAVDPFKSDPFENDTTKSTPFEEDPFGTSSTSAGAHASSADPFGSDPFGGTSAQQQPAAQDQKTTPTTTSSSSHPNGGSSFANFANFAQFAS